MRKLFIIFIAFMYCTACTEKKQVSVDQPSLIRWYENENEFEVYAVVSNQTKNDIQFQASILFIDEKLKQAIGFETDELQTDDRNTHSPFKLKSYNETVFIRKYKAKNKLTLDMLSNGVGIKFTVKEKTYTSVIKHIEKMPY